ncbi:GtrA family protein [Pseudoxanthomonas sp. JBR18]|uniref:GtrA family protein n=1 Tax=Pseudoxanthomonas sp. JBR18 TaxID=2969308 RepID=UPI002305DCF3|nr:GtrA family protein [Pseudoxanthomonas sp. JBR18]WCE05188.1 GtrA family protein [Pseudoxanthomonas sp. JBR18]
MANNALRGQLTRYLINGLVATVVHYSTLRFNLEVLQMRSAGIANALAALFGIAVSFVGSRYYVFRAAEKALVRQGTLFLSFYGLIALVHGLILYIWTDRAGLNYTAGFLVATVMQVCFSFVVNKFMVFK